METANREDTGNILELKSFGMWTFTQPFIMMMVIYFYLHYTLCITKQQSSGYSILSFIDDKEKAKVVTAFGLNNLDGLYSWWVPYENGLF